MAFTIFQTHSTWQLIAKLLSHCQVINSNNAITQWITFCAMV